jgi:hypothetical protein
MIYAGHPLLALVLPFVSVAWSSFVLTVIGGGARRAFLGDSKKPFAIDVLLGMLVCMVAFAISSLVRLPVADGALPLFLIILGWRWTRGSLVEAGSREHLVSLALLTASLVFSARCVIGPDYCGADAGIMALNLEPTRRAGFFTLTSLSGGLMSYPPLALLLPWTLATPLMSSLALEHLYPSFAVSLLVFGAFEICKGPRFAAFALRLSLLSFDVEIIAREYAGTLKLTHGVWLLLAAYAMMSRGRRIAWATVAIVACAIIALANPVNAPVAFTGFFALLLFGLASFVRDPSRPSVPRREQMLRLAAPFVIAAALCALFLAQGSMGVAAQGTPGGRLIDHFPELTWKPYRLVWPAETLLNHRGRPAMLLLAALGAFLLRRHAKRALLLGVIYYLCVCTCVVVFFYLQPSARHMLKFYTELAWVNGWSALITMCIATATTFFWHRRAVWLLLVLALWFTVKGLNRTAIVSPDVIAAAKKTANMASLSRDLTNALAPSDVVQPTTWFVDYGNEQWAWQTTEDVAFELASPRRSMYGFSYAGAWPAHAEMRQHNERLCQNDCAYLRRMGVTAHIVFTPSSRALCGLSCFSAAEEFAAGDMKATLLRITE